MVDKEIIAQRKRVYGDNFADISNCWSLYLDREVTSKDVAMMMSLMKQVRIDSIWERLGETQKDITNIDYFRTMERALEDSKTDKANYLFIATNWKWYENIGSVEDNDIGNFQIRFKKNPNA